MIQTVFDGHLVLVLGVIAVAFWIAARLAGGKSSRRNGRSGDGGGSWFDGGFGDGGGDGGGGGD